MAARARHPGMFALWIVPDWLGSGDLLHTFHLARISAEPRSLQGTGDPALELLRGVAGIEAAPVWIGALCGLAGRAHARSHRGGARSRRRGLGAADRRRHGDGLPGGPPLPRRSRGHRLRASPGSGGRRTRLASGRAAALRWRPPWSPSAPRSPSLARRLGHQARGARARADEVSALWRAVDQARRVGSRRAAAPVIQPSGMANGLAWKLGLPLDHVAAWFSPTARVAFIAGDDRPVIARLRRRNATGDASRPRPRGTCCWCGGARAAAR